jgi:hypothetical protein
MKKKINYGGVPDDVLDRVVGECYGLGEYSLRHELDKYGEDILAFQYNIKEYEDKERGSRIEWFRAWTKTYALILIDTMFGDRNILGLNREIPEELKFNALQDLKADRRDNGRTKEKKRRASKTNRKTTK